MSTSGTIDLNKDQIEVGQGFVLITFSTILSSSAKRICASGDRGHSTSKRQDDIRSLEDLVELDPLDIDLIQKEETRITIGQ